MGCKLCHQITSTITFLFIYIENTLVDDNIDQGETAENQNFHTFFSVSPIKQFPKLLIPRTKQISDSMLISSFSVEEKLHKQNNLAKQNKEKSIKIFNLQKLRRIKEFDESLDNAHRITEDQKKLIKKVLNDLDLCASFEQENIENLVNLFVLKKAQENSELFKSNSDANLIYIIANGSVGITTEPEESMQLFKSGDYFGIEALEENQKRICSAVAIKDTNLLCLTGEMYRNIIQQIYFQKQNKLMNMIRLLPLFKNLEISQVGTISESIIKKQYTKDSIIISEDEAIDRVFIIQEGFIRVTKRYKTVYKLGANECFGDIPLLIYTPSYYTYSVDGTDASILEIPFRAVKDLLGREYVKVLINCMLTHAIKRSRIIFEDANLDDINSVMDIFKLRYYTNGEIVFQSTLQKNKKLCIIISGKLKKGALGEIVAKTGDIYGEEIIDSKKDIDCNIVSVNISLTLEANWDDLLKNFKADEIILKDNIYETVCRLKKFPIFSLMSEFKLFQIAKKMKLEKYVNKENIIKDNDLGKLYIIKSGKVNAHREYEFIRSMEAGSCFGDISFCKNSIRTTSFKAMGNVECYILTKEYFSQSHDTSFKKYLQGILALHDIDISLHNLFYIKNLGRGKFGNVLLVHNKKNLYALKYSDVNAICEKTNLVHYYINEKNIMLKIDHPFVLKLVKTLKTDRNLFFLIEYIDGISLKNYLEKKKKKDSNNTFETAFFGGILLLVINYLNKKKIMHRDIKPDNCMIDRNGYLKLIDFGIGKELDKKDFTKTCCGTPHYMAPEVITGEGYSFSSDYWSIGVLMFEIFYGYRPFGEGSKNVDEIYSEILKKKLVLPFNQKFKDINNFFNIILSKNIIQRVCNFNQIIAHPFFCQIDFESLTDFDIKPPFIPDSFVDSTEIGGASILANKDRPLLRYLEELSSNSMNEDDEKREFNPILQRQKSWLSQF